jgi:hypothetical protein
MLSENDKSRIREEEAYRKVLRGDSSAHPIQTRIWNALNSNFVLWFLSAVVVAGFTSYLSWWQAERAEKARRQERIEKLDAEIACRFYDLDLMSIDFYTLQDNPVTPDLAKRILRSRGADGGCFPEFASRSLVSLVSELIQQLPSDDPERFKLEDAMNKVYDLNVRYGNAQITKANLGDFFESLKKVSDVRWSAVTRTLRSADKALHSK